MFIKDALADIPKVGWDVWASLAISTVFLHILHTWWFTAMYFLIIGMSILTSNIRGHSDGYLECRQIWGPRRPPAPDEDDYHVRPV